MRGPRERGCRRARTWRRAITSNSSSAWPAPSATQVSGESATSRRHLRLVVAAARRARAAARRRRRAGCRCSRMSEDSSGGVGRASSRTASTIACTGSASAGAHLVGRQHHRLAGGPRRGRGRALDRRARRLERPGRADRELDLLGRLLADREVVLAPDVGHDRLVEVVAAEPQRRLARRSRPARSPRPRWCRRRCRPPCCPVGSAIGRPAPIAAAIGSSISVHLARAGATGTPPRPRASRPR